MTSLNHFNIFNVFYLDVFNLMYVVFFGILNNKDELNESYVVK